MLVPALEIMIFFLFSSRGSVEKEKYRWSKSCQAVHNWQLIIHNPFRRVVFTHFLLGIAMHGSVKLTIRRREDNRHMMSQVIVGHP